METQNYEKQKESKSQDMNSQLWLLSQNDEFTIL